MSTKYEPVNESIEVSSAAEAPKSTRRGCCGKCCGSMKMSKDDDDPENYIYGPESKKFERCHDVPCLLLFGVAWVGLLAVMIVAFVLGDWHRLMHAEDYNGNLCGRDNPDYRSGETVDGVKYGVLEGNLIDLPKGAYPRLADDLRLGMDLASCSEDISACKIPMYTVCVEKCPLAGDVVCDYRAAAVGIITDADRLAAASAGGDSCWFTPIDTIERLNRCIPQPEVTKHRSWYCEEYDMHYRQEGSWVVESTAKAVFGSQVGVWSSVNTWIKGRCIAEDGQVQSEFLTKETCEATAQPVTIPACPASRKCTENDCNGKIVEKTVEVETEAVGTASLLSSLVSTTRMLTEAMQDVQTLKSHILTIGAGASVVVAFSLIIFLRIFAGVAVWTIICLLWLAVLLLDMYAFIQAGDFFGIDLSNATTALQSHIFLEEGKAKDVLDDQLTASEEYAALWQLASYVLLLLVVIYFFIVCVLADKIALCIKIIRNSGKFITHVPTVVFVPAFVFIWIIVWASLFLGIAIAVSTVGDLSIADVGAAYNAATKFKCPEGESEFSCIRDRLAISSSGFANSTSGLDNDINNKMRAKAATMASTGISLESELMRPMLAFTGFMFLWTTAATTGFGVVCMATTVATIYWEPARDGAQWSWKSACCTVITATKEVARYHFGSICFGALVVSIAQTIRLVVSYWMRQAEHLREMHKFVHYAMKVCACCLWCLEKIVKYLTKNAYIVMAITGQNFLCSAWGAFKLVAANPLRVFLVQSIANIIVLLGKLVITGFVTGGFFFYISNGEQFKPGGSHEITSPIAPTIFVGLLSFFVASAFMAAYDCATDTLLLSFLLDEKYAKTLGSSYKIHASAHGMDTFMDSMGATQEDEDKHAEQTQATKDGQAKPHQPSQVDQAP